MHVRTTLDLNEKLLVAAKARAREQGITLGSAISALALAGLAAEDANRPVDDHGLRLLPHLPGHVITDEMVADALADE